MTAIDQEKMRSDLIEVLSGYLKDPTDGRMKKRARELHNIYGNAGREVDKYLRHAVNMLVDIGYDMPQQQKPPKDVVEQFVLMLATRKA